MFALVLVKMIKIKKETIELMNALEKHYNQTHFIELDPVSIPHQFSKRQDIEIAGLFAAVFAWGQRVTILSKANNLLQRMDNSPHDFIINHTDKDLAKMLGFVHRTFNDTDLLYFIEFLKFWYSRNESLESAFLYKGLKLEPTIESGLNNFRAIFFSLADVPKRTQKHISSPNQGSACKRLNMFLRWMVRSDSNGVDFGIWKGIKSSQLICPLDLHVARVARKFGLLEREQNDWKSAIELTNNLKLMDKNDPVKYDFALFGAGVEHVF